MKKQFFRVKQLADQTFLGADKSEGLNHGELQKADHRVEYFRTALSAISKKMPVVQLPNNNENVEKRMKKYPEYQLGQTLLEQSKKGFINGDEEDDRNLFQHVIRQCGLVQQDLAQDMAEHEIKVENMVCLPLQEVIENEIPVIMKQKRQLSKHILDKDSARNRLQAVSKNGTQRETLKEEHEEAELKVDQSRDALAAEMFTMLRKENELSQYMLQILKLQRGYHESALKNLEKVIPELEKKIGDSSVKAVFGIPLEEHLRVTHRRIAYPIELCISILTELGMSEEGLFRVTGANSRVKRLKLSLDSGCFEPPLVDEYRDVHVISSTLKLYLRELPEPLLTTTLYKEWMNCVGPHKTEEQRLNAVKEVLRKLPTSNHENLTYLIQFLSKLSKHPENKMSSLNIAICIAPNLLWNNEEEINLHMNNCSIVNMIVETFIAHADVLFPEDLTTCNRLSIGELLGEHEHEFVRPVVHGLKNKSDHEMGHDNDSYGESSSPKPQTRNKKKAAAPIPPSMMQKSETDFVSIDRASLTASYPSGSTTLTRIKPRNDGSPKMKTSVGVNTDEISVRRRSLVGDENNAVKNESPKAILVNDDAKSAEAKGMEDLSAEHKVIETRPVEVKQLDAKTVDPKIIADHKYVSQPTTNIQVSKAKPVQPLQVTIAEKPPINNALQKSANGQINSTNDTTNKPVAAPRSLHNIDTEKATLRIENPLTKPLEPSDGENTVQLRKTQITDNGFEKPHKPVIPARPASLRGISRSIDVVDPAVQKTQCSVYSVANKQQPSIVNIQNRQSAEKFQMGHDVQIAEKEKFLGHPPQDQSKPNPRQSLENKFNDINFNCDNTHRDRTSSIGVKPDIPAKPTIMKSTEKLNVDHHEKFNGNSKSSHHVRTRSDGNIIDFNSVCSVLHTPPSPRALNKPTQPPPPPPVAVQRPKSEPDSTDL